MRRAGIGFVTRSAGAERRGGALADVIVSIRSRTAELIRGPAGDSFGLARQGGWGGLRGRSRTRLGVQELLQKSRCQPSAEVGGGRAGGDQEGCALATGCHGRPAADGPGRMMEHAVCRTQELLVWARAPEPQKSAGEGRFPRSQGVSTDAVGLAVRAALEVVVEFEGRAEASVGVWEGKCALLESRGASLGSTWLRNEPWRAGPRRAAETRRAAQRRVAGDRRAAPPVAGVVLLVSAVLRTDRPVLARSSTRSSRT